MKGAFVSFCAGVACLLFAAVMVYVPAARRVVLHDDGQLHLRPAAEVEP